MFIITTLQHIAQYLVTQKNFVFLRSLTCISEDEYIRILQSSKILKTVTISLIETWSDSINMCILHQCLSTKYLWPTELLAQKYVDLGELYMPYSLKILKIHCNKKKVIDSFEYSLNPQIHIKKFHFHHFENYTKTLYFFNSVHIFCIVYYQERLFHNVFYVL